MQWPSDRSVAVAVADVQRVTSFIALYTVGDKKGATVFDCNCAISWAIFVLFVAVETGISNYEDKSRN